MINRTKYVEKNLNELSNAEKQELLKELRNDVDKIDEKIISLLNKRTISSVMVGRIKRVLNLPVYTPAREKEISDRINKYLEEPLTKKSLKRIYERILDESRAAQKKDRDQGEISKILLPSKKIKFKELLTKKEFLIVAGFFAILLLIFLYTFYTPNHYEGKSPIKFDIRRGETFDHIVDSLYSKKIIPSRRNFQIAAMLYGAEKKIKAARYYIPNDLSYLDLLDFFIDGKPEFIKEVKVRSGLTIKWMAWRLQHDAGIDSAKFVELCKNKYFVDSLGFKFNTLQGYLFPGDYYLYENSTAKETVDTMLNHFQKFWVDSLKLQASKLGYSIHQILTLASIVKGETDDVSEMPVIAAVYYNRLKLGMKLQADPTVQYLQPNGWKKLTYKDLQIDSPYNTYLYAGLPPGPINNPGKGAILAVLYPDNNKYLYFVADGTGGHKFAKTYYEHLKNVRKYRRWLRSQK